MNSSTQKELLDVIMLDEFVARREALLTWAKRWVWTLKCSAAVDSNTRDNNRMEKGPEEFDRMEKAAFLDQIFMGVLNASAKVVDVRVEEGFPDTVITTKIHVILQEPRS